MTTAGAVQAEGAAAVSDATVAELVGKLRSSKFGGRFATWVEENWRDMVKNPRLKEGQAPKRLQGQAVPERVPGTQGQAEDLTKSSSSDPSTAAADYGRGAAASAADSPRQDLGIPDETGGSNRTGAVSPGPRHPLRHRLSLQTAWEPGLFEARILHHVAPVSSTHVAKRPPNLLNAACQLAPPR